MTDPIDFQVRTPAKSYDDITLADLDDLFDRADDVWERAKGNR